MKVVLHQLLPESYLLVLAPGPRQQHTSSLAQCLRQAQRSGRRAVWVDCGMLPSLSVEAARLLGEAHLSLQQAHTQLVLVHVADDVRDCLLDYQPAAAFCILPTLLDAARQPH